MGDICAQGRSARATERAPVGRTSMCGMAFANRKPGHGVLCRTSGAVVVLAMLVGSALTWLPLRALAAEPDSTEQEFVAFLEYLGSWNGNEEDWVQFLDATNSDFSPDADDIPAAADATPASPVKPPPQEADLQLAVSGT